MNCSYTGCLLLEQATTTFKYYNAETPVRHANPHLQPLPFLNTVSLFTYLYVTCAVIRVSSELIIRTLLVQSREKIVVESKDLSIRTVLEVSDD